VPDFRSSGGPAEHTGDPQSAPHGDAGLLSGHVGDDGFDHRTPSRDQPQVVVAGARASVDQARGFQSR
jgi:hypothetical protein